MPGPCCACSRPLTTICRHPDNKNARPSLRQIIRELGHAEARSPVVLNGSPFGFFANHSLVMANYISRANAAIIDLRDLLRRG